VLALVCLSICFFCLLGCLDLILKLCIGYVFFFPLGDPRLAADCVQKQQQLDLGQMERKSMEKQYYYGAPFLLAFVLGSIAGPPADHSNYTLFRAVGR